MDEPTMEFAELCALVGARLTGQGGRILLAEVERAAQANGLAESTDDLKLFLEGCCGCVVEGLWYIQRATAYSEAEPTGKQFRVLGGGRS
jgi:hypothetical protein